MRLWLAAIACAGCTSTVDGFPSVDAGEGTEVDAVAQGSGSGSGQLPAYEVVSKFGHDLIRTVTVHKNGGEDRTVYVEAARAAQLTATAPLADTTRLVMQVNAGSAFVIEKVGGAWQYGIVSGNPASLATAPDAGCAGCHGGAAEPGVFTAPSLRRLLTTHVAEEITCPMGPGPQPCAAAVYQ